jgi:hypothetical protein
VFVAASPPVRGVGGHYFEGLSEAETVFERNGHQSGVTPYALNPDNAARLWRAFPVAAALKTAVDLVRSYATIPGTSAADNRTGTAGVA